MRTRITCFVSKGVSLIECIFFIAVAVILLSISLPAFHSFLVRQDRDIVFDNLTNALSLAKNEAILHQKPMVLCASQDKKNCGGTWSQGFIVTNLNNTPLDSSLHSFPGSRYATIHFLAFGQSSQQIKILSDGSLYQNGKFLYCIKNQAQGALILNREAGRPRIELDSNENCPIPQ